MRHEYTPLALLCGFGTDKEGELLSYEVLKQEVHARTCTCMQI